MAIIEMIPREYWRQMYEELSCIDWGHHRTDADILREKERERRAAEYDAAIERNTRNKKNKTARSRYYEYQKRWRAEHREQLNAHQREYRKRKAAQEKPQE